MPSRARSERRPLVFIIAGPAGSGKTTVGEALALYLGYRFLDADSLHDVDAVATMSAGRALTDADRAPWLHRVRERIEAALREEDGLVVACSALKRAYQALLLQPGEATRLVWLDVPPGTLHRRLFERKGHFAGPRLLDSQLDAAEPPEAGRVDADAPLSMVLAAILRRGSEGEVGPGSAD